MSAKREPLIFALTAAGAAALLLSIAAGEIVLTAALIGWVIWRPRTPNLPSYFIPMCVFILTTFVSVVVSPVPAVDWAVRKTILFSMSLLAATFVTTSERARTCYTMLLGVATLTSTLGLVQFGITYLRYLRTHRLADDPTILARMTGFMGHWMTFSGEQMLVWCAAVPALLYLGRRWLTPITVIGCALVLSFTRSVWIGAAVGVAVVSFMMPKRLLAMVLLPVLLIVAVTSPLIYHRISVSFTTKNFQPDTSRIELWKTGIQMIRQHPFFGVGPERIAAEFPRYFTGEKLPDYYGHLHNNFVQIAAERGLISFAAFLWFILEIFAGLLRMVQLQDHSARWTALAAIAALTAFIVAGLAEYNFGDSEVLLLLLFIVSIPYGVFSNDTTHRPELRNVAKAG